VPKITSFRISWYNQFLAYSGTIFFTVLTLLAYWIFSGEDVIPWSVFAIGMATIFFMLASIYFHRFKYTFLENKIILTGLLLNTVIQIEDVFEVWEYENQSLILLLKDGQRIGINISVVDYPWKLSEIIQERIPNYLFQEPPPPSIFTFFYFNIYRFTVITMISTVISVVFGFILPLFIGLLIGIVANLYLVHQWRKEATTGKMNPSTKIVLWCITVFPVLATSIIRNGSIKNTENSELARVFMDPIAINAGLLCTMIITVFLLRHEIKQIISERSR
jgi:hypothetical protein